MVGVINVSFFLCRGAAGKAAGAESKREGLAKGVGTRTLPKKYTQRRRDDNLKRLPGTIFVGEHLSRANLFPSAADSLLYTLCTVNKIIYSGVICKFSFWAPSFMILPCNWHGNCSHNKGRECLWEFLRPLKIRPARILADRKCKGSFM